MPVGHLSAASTDLHIAGPRQLSGFISACLKASTAAAGRPTSSVVSCPDAACHRLSGTGSSSTGQCFPLRCQCLPHTASAPLCYSSLYSHQAKIYLFFLIFFLDFPALPPSAVQHIRTKIPLEAFHNTRNQRRRLMSC